MGEMFVQVKSDSGSVEEEGLTLAEQTRQKVFLQDEDQLDREMREIEGASIQEVRSCEKIGFINFDKEEVDQIDSMYVDESTTAESAYLGGFAGNGNSISNASQRGGEVYVEFNDGHSVTVAGRLDRAYTY